jgi:hypothetical protein
MVGGRGDSNPAELSCTMEPVKLEKDMGIAVQSIAYGDVQNITDLNNSFMVRLNLKYIDELQNSTNKRFKATDLKARLRISNGRYDLVEDVLKAMIEQINNYAKKIGSKERCVMSRVFGKANVNLPKEIKLLARSREGPLSVIGAYITESSITALDGRVPRHSEMCFMYLNIVQNSFINGKKSRLVCIFPIHSEKGYSYHEFNKATYIPIEVREFSHISLTLRDIKGKLISIGGEYDTVITLHMKPLKNEVV